MSILEIFISIFAPHCCVGCQLEGALLCADCQRRLQPAPSNCYRCGSATADDQSCAPCWRSTGLYRVQAATPYKGLAKELLWRLKFNGNQGAAAVMAKCLLQLELPAAAVIVHIPTATSRIRQRGYDQAELLARVLAHLRPLEQARLLARQGQQHQRGASRQQRLRQLETAYRVTKSASVRGAHIVLVDDVITTGASLQAAAAALLAAGAWRVEAVVFARA